MIRLYLIYYVWKKNAQKIHLTRKSQSYFIISKHSQQQRKRVEWDLEIRFLYGTIWVIFWGVLKTVFLPVFNLQFLDFTYLQTWDTPARVREYPIKLFKVESLGLGLRFRGPNSHRTSQNHFWGSPRENPSWYQIKTLVHLAAM